MAAERIECEFGGADADPVAQKALEVAVAHVRQSFPMRPDDDAQLMVDKLSEITQDPDADPLMQEIASRIQLEYFQRLMAMQPQQQEQPAKKPAGGAGGPGAPQSKGNAGSPTSEAVQNVGGAVRELTNAATAA